MASSGYFDVDSYQGRYIRFYWEEISQDIEKNTTTISWKLHGGGDAPSSWYASGDHEVVIDGETVFNNSSRIHIYKDTVIASGTKTITHNADGSRTFSATATASLYEFAVVYKSGYWALDVIPRASVPTVSASSVTMLNNVTITTNRKSTAFTHDLSYSFGGKTGSIATGVGASYTWAVPDLVANIPGRSSGTCTITCITKNGSTVIGTKTVTLTLNIPAISTISVSASKVQMGNSVTINITRKSTGYTHTLTYAVGSASGTIGSGVTTSSSWTPLKAIAQDIGNKLSAECTITCETYNGSLLVGKSTATVTLTVPDATVPELSATEVDMGQSITISMSKEADAYTHDLSYTFAGMTGTIASGVSGDYAWEVPLDLAKKIPSATEGEVVITCKTRFKNSTTEIGTATVRFKAKVPNNSETQPKATMEVSAVNPFEGLYLTGRSKVKVSYEASSDYSTIEAYSTALFKGTGIVSAYEKGSTNPYESAVLTDAGNVTITGTVTDARGYSSEQTKSIEVVDYSRPRITPYTGEYQIVCMRCNSDKAPDPGGVRLLIRVGRKYSKVISNGEQKNRCSISYRWKTDSETEEAYRPPVILLSKEAEADSLEVVLEGIVTSNTTAYNIQLIAEDDVGGIDTVTITIPTAFAAFHIPKGGHGFTMGGYHDPSMINAFVCWFDAHLKREVMIGDKTLEQYILYVINGETQEE